MTIENNKALGKPFPQGQFLELETFAEISNTGASAVRSSKEEALVSDFEEEIQV